jgi:Siphovirus Gp157
VSRLKARLKDYLECTDRTKAVTSSGKMFAIQKNGGASPLVVAEDLDLSTLDQRFVRTVASLDTSAVRAAIAAGEDVPFASLGETGSHLRIR